MRTNGSSLTLGRRIALVLAVTAIDLVALASNVVATDNAACVDCHRKTSPALVMQWESSLHFGNEVGCIECHGANEGEIDAWEHEGEFVSALVTPLDCATCHDTAADHRFDSQRTEVVETALHLVGACSSACETACVDCLWTFRNAYYHKYLDRKKAQECIASWGVGLSVL